MRFALVFLCLVVFASAAIREDFCKKLRNMAIVFWSEANLCKIADAVLNDIRGGFTMDQIAEKGIKYVTPNTPIFDYTKLLGLMTSMDKCLKNAGSKRKTFDVIGLALPVFVNNLKGPYGVISDKMKKMKSNKKTDKEQMTQAYTLANASVTKPLIQKIISNSSKKMNAKEWKCACDNLPTVVKMSNFDTKKLN